MPLENMRHEPYSLPAGFQWDTLNLDDPIVVNIGCPIIIWTGLYIKIGIVQKVYE